MNPGRDLDALIAEKVMGIKVTWEDNPFEENGPDEPFVELEGGKYSWSKAIREYSTDIAAAMMIVDKLPYEFRLIKVGDKFQDLYSKPGTKFKACITVDNGKHYQGWSEESMAHAICLAALKVMEAGRNQPPQNP